MNRPLDLTMDSYQPSREGASYEIPPLINQPPQVFGPYAPTSPTNGLYSADYFGEEQTGGTAEESNEAKRRRIARVWAGFPLLVVKLMGVY